MNLDQYLAKHEPGNVPTPVVVTHGNGKTEIRSLSSLLYGTPPPETKGRLRRRMADLIRQRVTSTGSVTLGDLAAGGFTAAEIDAHYQHAKRLSDVIRLGDML